MGSLKSLLFIYSFVILANFCTTEFVPVYMWGTHSTSKPVPALHKTSQSSFKDLLSNKLGVTSIIVVFAEQSLSPEDFGQRDNLGNVAYPILSKVRKSSKATYLASVQNPIKAVKHASDDVVEISIERLKENLEIPEAKIVIVDLNDASENEERFDMLKRHDKLIGSIYDNLLKKHDKVLAIYTANRASWIGSGAVHSRRTRALESGEVNQYMDNSTIMFYTSGSAIAISTNKTDLINITYSATNDSNGITLTGNGANLVLSFQFISSPGGYWYLQEANITLNTITLNQIVNTTVYAPLGFSYACGNQTFNGSNIAVIFPQFQVEPVFKSTYLLEQGKFDDPYHCVGFTTIPIWSGLFVTFILLLIMTFGLTMMMDIKTMDRFDDAKGKTITINTSE